MANGNILDLGFSDIYGAQGGGQDLGNVMNALLNQLYFGANAEAGGGTGTANINLPSYMTEDSQSFDPFNIWTGAYDESGEAGASPYEPTSSATGMQDYLNWFSEFASLGSGAPWTEGGLPQGMSALQDLFEKINIPALTQGYAQDIGDVQTQMGGKIKGLQSAYTGKRGKGQRYGGIGTGSRAPGSRGDYLSDYYGLTDEMAQMQQSLQGGLESDFMGNIHDWLGTMTPGGYL
jgi:hypothetical protein